jgi:hypothetical protein
MTTTSWALVRRRRAAPLIAARPSIAGLEGSEALVRGKTED